MAVRTTTKSRRCSKRSRGRCVWPARATSNSARCCPAPKAGCRGRFQGDCVIAVIDYKAGNLASVMKAVTAVGAQAQLTDDPSVIEQAEKIILPGVGHFAATQLLRESGIEAAVCRQVGRGV